MYNSRIKSEKIDCLARVSCMSILLSIRFFSPDVLAHLAVSCSGYTFYNNSVISWQSDILVEETEVPRQNHQTSTSFWQIFIIKCSIEYTFACACMFKKWTLNLNSERHLIAYLYINSTTIVSPLGKRLCEFL